MCRPISGNFQITLTLVLAIETTHRTKAFTSFMMNRPKFINKYEGYKTTICFLNLENMIENVRKNYANIEGPPENERPLAQSLMKEEIEKVTEKLVRKRMVKNCVSLKTVSRWRTVANRIFLFKI